MLQLGHAMTRLASRLGMYERDVNRVLVTGEAKLQIQVRSSFGP